MIGPPSPFHNFYRRADDVVDLSSWLLTRNRGLKRICMGCGGVQSVVNQTWIDLVRGQASTKDLPFTTLVCNQARWTLFRMRDQCAPRDLPEEVHILDNFDLEKIESQHSDDATRHLEIVEVKEHLHAAIRGLTYRQREVIRLRYGMNDGYSYRLEAVARIFGVTRERIRQIESQAIKRLQRNWRLERKQMPREESDTYRRWENREQHARY